MWLPEEKASPVVLSALSPRSSHARNKFRFFSFSFSMGMRAFFLSRQSWAAQDSSALGFLAAPRSATTFLRALSGLALGISTANAQRTR